jgi:hypothetical protein
MRDLLAGDTAPTNGDAVLSASTLEEAAKRYRFGRARGADPLL